jgi:ArsR family transcriptional regulator
MELTQIHQCLSDPLRVRMVRLLTRGPLCVRHFERILGAGQVSVSKHLGFLKKRGLVVGERRGHWMVHRLARGGSEAVRATLDSLERCVADDPVFAADLRALAGLALEIQSVLATTGTDTTQEPGRGEPPSPPGTRPRSLWELADGSEYVD